MKSFITQHVQEMLAKRQQIVFRDYVRHGQVPAKVVVELRPGPVASVVVVLNGGTKHTWTEGLGNEKEPLVKKAS